MLKILKRLRPVHWLLVGVIVGLTVLQVYCTMTLVDEIQNVIQSIMMLNYRNNPTLIDDGAGAIAALVESLGGWENVSAETLGTVLPETMHELIPTLVKIASASTGDIWFYGGMMLLVAFASFAAQGVIGVIAAYIAASLSKDLRSSVYGKINSFSAAEMDKFSTPSLITRTTNDVQQVQMSLVLTLRMAIAAPITAIWAICKIHATSAELTIATAIAIVVLVVFLVALMIIVLPKFKVTQKLLDRLNGVSRENLTGIRVVRAYNAEQYQEQKFDKANNDITKVQLFTSRLMALMSPVMMIIMNGISLAIYWIGAKLINAGSTDYATVTAFMSLSSQIIMAFMMLLMMFILLPRAQVSASRINEVLDTEPSIKDPEVESELTEKGTVEFENVSFAYPGSDDATIKNISFKAEKGQTVAFIGATGSGKSTVINLVPRFYDATQGTVRVDGVDVRNIKQEHLQKLIGYVPQRGVLFTGSVRDNIAFGANDITDEEVVAAAKVAEADEFVSAMEDGYNSHISQGGKNVSGGQKQRLSIARAVATQPEIFIFDDSFSALDYKTDKKVRDNLKEVAKDSTKLIVAQRIGTIMDADKIIVLEDGEAVGIGTHKELLNNCPVYREIALSQLSAKELGIEEV